MREIALFSGKIYTASTNFTRPPVVTVATNLNSFPNFPAWGNVGAMDILAITCAFLDQNARSWTANKCEKRMFRQTLRWGGPAFKAISICYIPLFWHAGDHPVMKTLPKWLLLHSAPSPSTCKLSRAINYSSCPSRTPFSTRWSATSHPQTHFLLPPVLLWIILRLDVDQLSSSLVIWLHLQLWLQSNSASLSLSWPQPSAIFLEFENGKIAWWEPWTKTGCSKKTSNNVNTQFWNTEVKQQQSFPRAFKI